MKTVEGYAMEFYWKDEMDWKDEADRVRRPLSSPVYILIQT